MKIERRASIVQRIPTGCQKDRMKRRRTAPCWSGCPLPAIIRFMTIDPAIIERLKSHVNRHRLVETARRLIDVPSPTGQAKAVSDRLAEILAADGFQVDRPTGGYPQSPAVLIRLDSGRPGRTLQFNGHLDTVHLPFVPSEIMDGCLTGSGASDMKGGLAAAVEAIRGYAIRAGSRGVGTLDRP